jgi:transcriptional regulator with XRE-family HTH domain
MKHIPETFAEMVGLRLAAIRKVKEISQDEAGRYIGITQSAYSRIERGTTTLNITQLRRLARFFDMPPSELARDLFKAGERAPWI